MQFKQVRAIEPTCGAYDCMVKYAEAVAAKKNAARAREESRLHREAKAKIKTRQQWMGEAQAAFNRWIRARDAGLPCISCGRHHQGQWHAGHYRSVGSNPALRFDPANVHKQCQPCNTHLSGNAIEYRIGLVARIGLAEVERLEGQQEPKKYMIGDLQDLKRKYNSLARELEKKNLQND